MGLIKAASGATGGVLADQWKEYFTAKPFLRMFWQSRGGRRSQAVPATPKAMKILSPPAP